MNARQWILLIHFYCFCFGIANRHFAVGPSNTAVIVGNRMAMGCCASNGSNVFKWMITKPDSDRKEQIVRKRNSQIFPSSKFSQYGFEVDENGSDVIFINSTQISDAGIYFCHVEYSNYQEQTQYSAHLIVFDEPLCETNYNMTLAEHDSIWMNCSVDFRGFWLPSVEWRQHSGNHSENDEGQVITEGVLTQINGNITSTLVVKNSFEKSTYFSFKIFFMWQGVTKFVNASNVPDFQYIWKSPKMKPPDTNEPEILVPEPEMASMAAVKIPVKDETKSSNWFVTSLVLSGSLLLVILFISGIGGRICCARYRRIKGLEKRTFESGTTKLNGLERPSSGSYDSIPAALPNIYDCIDDSDTSSDLIGESSVPTQKHPPLMLCYSSLSDETTNRPNDYDALSHYLAMDKHSDPDNKPVNVGMGVGSQGRKDPEMYPRDFSEVDNYDNNVSTTNYIDLVSDEEEEEASISNGTLAVTNVEATDKSEPDYLNPVPWEVIV